METLFVFYNKCAKPLGCTYRSWFRVVSSKSLSTSWMNMYMSRVLATICMRFRRGLFSVRYMFVVHLAFVQILGCGMSFKQ